ncbi:hypothetical protein K505DRAFT_264383 [Melanomma pulvis-pyrius CBS 109.77]|uniref:Uncharacterized protein n=1 Tax=Melanomma pulvis-pyrius CBS 109.77 TaxID=1314802 RepID=A0A6A6XV74_9PLEO|nr:hypothetical protein K505DRAFT_264383 [Melanomma pulvis-pyrius CBS 109.77]
MAGDLEAMPMSPRRSPAEVGGAVLQWVRSRRGRALAMSAVFILFVLGLAGMKHSETISSKYQALSSNYHLPSWRPHLPNLPSIISSPLEPSNASLELENDSSKQVPWGLNKATPNFHLLMPALDDSPEFCKTTLSAMLLNYPPPTIINLYQTFKAQVERESARLKGILEHLNNKKLVTDEDLVLIVDGVDTWFQLPSDVMIRQYQNVLADANQRLMNEYGVNGENMQRFNQTIVFGAEKRCEGEDLACRYAPDSILPGNIYGENTGKEAVLTPARYLDSRMLIGPAKDLRALYKAALTKFEAENSQAGTAQSVFATMFGEQQLARDAKPKDTKTTTTKWLDWFGGQAGEPEQEEEQDNTANATLKEGQQYEFSMGLDYTHTLFQPFVYVAEDELVPLPHDNSTDLSTYHHADTPTPLLHIPTALQQAKPPFWTPDLSRNNPRPENVKPAFIEKLEISQKLDELKPRDTPWASLKLIQNTYTGAIPAALHLNTPSESKIKTAMPQRANLIWSSLWYAGYERALLRAYLRLPQSPIGYHDAVIGGDRQWDQRGGRGGVWTQKESIWLPWGEVDGVCGTLDQLKLVFGDGKGVWLHENDKNAEAERKKEEKEFQERVAEEKKKDEERKKKGGGRRSRRMRTRRWVR